MGKDPAIDIREDVSGNVPAGELQSRGTHRQMLDMVFNWWVSPLAFIVYGAEVCGCEHPQMKVCIKCSPMSGATTPAVSNQPRFGGAPISQRQDLGAESCARVPERLKWPPKLDACHYGYPEDAICSHKQSIIYRIHIRRALASCCLLFRRSLSRYRSVSE